MTDVGTSEVALGYRTAFDLAPVGLVLSRNRLMLDCNRQLLRMFGATRDALVGQSFELLYPTHAEFERTGERIVASLNASGWYADERVMRRVGATGGAHPGSCSGAASAGEHSTRCTRTPKASGASRTCRRGASCASS